MRVDKICYEQLYPTGVYANQRYRVEIILEPMDLANPDLPQSDVAKRAFQKAKEIVEKTFIALNPQINWNEENIGMGLPLTSGQNGSQPTITQVEKPIRDTIDNIIEDINSCKELKVLESYKLIAKTNSRIQEAYTNKLNSFTV